MADIDLGTAVPISKLEQLQAQYGDELEGWGIHDCCCDHVIETLDAAPGTRKEHYSAARGRYYACPHHWLTPLEVWMGSLL
jgi:hypothetical protein